MDKKQFLKYLNGMGVTIIEDIPSGYDYSIDDKTLTMKLSKKGVCSNMQNDISAFDSWAFAFKCYCPSLINDVVIDWEDPGKIEGIEKQHFDRFVYRLTKFIQTYEWVSTKKSISSIPQNILCSAPSKNAAPKEKHKKESEGWYECEYVEKNRNNYDAIDHQLPVGLFDGCVTDHAHFTPGRMSQIDIWAIKGNTLQIFELKKPGNKPLGIISELMFYTNVVSDLLSGTICIDQDKAERAMRNHYRSFDKFYDFIHDGKREEEKSKHIESIFLANELHTLLSEDIIRLINTSSRLKRLNIIFKFQRINS